MSLLRRDSDIFFRVSSEGGPRRWAASDISCRVLQERFWPRRLRKVSSETFLPFRAFDCFNRVSTETGGLF